jgi:hypothetical protein
MELRARESETAAANAACDEHPAVGQQRCRMTIVYGVEAACYRPKVPLAES